MLMRTVYIKNDTNSDLPDFRWFYQTQQAINSTKTRVTLNEEFSYY